MPLNAAVDDEPAEAEARPKLLASANSSSSSLRTLRFGDRTISYDAGLDSIGRDDKDKGKKAEDRPLDLIPHLRS